MNRGVKKAQQVLLCLLLTCLMLGLFALPVTVQAEDTADIVSNMAELQDWLTANPAGGTITLAENIEITEPVGLYLCRVEAESPLVLPAWVTLDTCIVSPDISGGTVISRKITEVKPSFPFLLGRGEEGPGFFDNLDVRCFLTLAAEGMEDEYKQVYIRFDDSGIDFDTPGEFLLPGTLLPPYDDLYAFDIVPQDKPLAAALTIYDPAIPYFYNSNYYFGAFAIGYYYSGKYEDLTLHRSDDAGESWYIYWQPGEEESESFFIDYNGYNLDLLFFDPAELSAPALFVFEVGKGIGSGILYIDTTTVKSVGQGGDRDSGDRILLPWEFYLGNPGEDDNKNPPPNTGDETGNTNPPPNTGDETGNTNPPPNTEDDTGNTNPPPNTGDETGNTNPPPNTEDETGNTKPPVKDNTANDDNSGNNRRTYYNNPTIQPAYAHLALLDVSTAITANEEEPLETLPAPETALPDTSGEIIAAALSSPEPAATAPTKNVAAAAKESAPTPQPVPLPTPQPAPEEYSTPPVVAEAEKPQPESIYQQNGAPTTSFPLLGVTLAGAGTAVGGGIAYSLLKRRGGK